MIFDQINFQSKFPLVAHLTLNQRLIRAVSEVR